MIKKTALIACGLVALLLAAIGHLNTTESKSITDYTFQHTMLCNTPVMIGISAVGLEDELSGSELAHLINRSNTKNQLCTMNQKPDIVRIQQIVSSAVHAKYIKVWTVPE
jgi:hypothetical protein